MINSGRVKSTKDRTAFKKNVTVSCLSIAALLLSACNSSSTPSTPPETSKTISIKRDQYGMPHIYADETYGLFYGYGYAIATDRLFQMEMSKRTGWGTTAEVLGKEYLAFDIATHSRFDPKSIRQQLDKLSPEDKAIFDGYAAGFTRRVQEVIANPELMPKEFIDYGFKPSEWKSEDIAMVWVGLILNRFFASSSEVANLDLYTELQKAKGAEEGKKIYNQLRWLNDPTAPTIVDTENSPLKAQAQISKNLKPISSYSAQSYMQQMRLTMGNGVVNDVPTASNAWVLNADKTQEGQAVLYNAPQQGWYTPAITYGIGLHGAGYDLTGITPVGLPAILFGTNGKIAWGSTVGSLDTNDIYQIQLNPSNPKEYLYQGKYIPFDHKQIKIKVLDQEDHLLDVYKTKQGFVSSWDQSNHTAYATRRSWEGQEIETLLGWAEAAKTTNWKDFLTQASRVAASITWFYADTQNNIGVAALGRLPIRPTNQNIQLPAVGDGSMEWQGFYDFSKNPQQLNPSKGYIASWNNKAYNNLFADSSNFSYVDRVNEILEPLKAKEKFSQQDIWEINRISSRSDLNARYFIPDMIKVAKSEHASALAQSIAPLLEQWDMKLNPDSTGKYYQGAAPTIMRAWLDQMIILVLKPNLPATIYQKYTDTLYPVQNDPRSAQPAPASKLIWNALQKNAGVPQQVDFLGGENPDHIVLNALELALKQLKTQYKSENPNDWKTPVANMHFSAKNSVGIPWADLKSEQQLSTYSNAGSASFKVVLSPNQVSMCSVIAPGQSGFVHKNGQLDAHFADQLALFESFNCKQDPVSKKQISEATKSEITLKY